jgi:hypothetical protein
MEDLMTDSSSSLGGLSVLDERGDQVTFRSLWESGPVVVAFVRHFG